MKINDGQIVKIVNKNNGKIKNSVIWKIDKHNIYLVYQEKDFKYMTVNKKEIKNVDGVLTLDLY
jgi:hypothetical protein